MSLKKDGSVLLRAGNQLITNCDCCEAGDIFCNDCETNCWGETPGNVTLTISGFVDHPDFPTTTCAVLNGTYVLEPYDPQYYACMWRYYLQDGDYTTEITLGCDMYVAYPDQWTLTVKMSGPPCYNLPWPPYRICTWLACGFNFGEMPLNCSGNHPTGSGPLYSEDAGGGNCGQCRDQVGTFSLS